MLTTQFFALKIQRYMDEHGISRSTLARVAEKAFANGARTPNAWRRAPVDRRRRSLESPMVNDPLTKYMFCSPAEGAVALVLARGERGARSWRDAGRPALGGVPHAPHGSFEVFSPVDRHRARRRRRPPIAAARRVRAWPASGPATSTSRSSRTPSPAPRSCTWPRTASARDGEQEALLQSGATEIGGRLPINTDGGCLACGEPIGASGLRQVYEVVLQLRGDAGARQVPGRRASATAMSTAPPASAPARC